MDPQHLARLDDDGSVRRSRARAAGGTSATVSPEGPEVPAATPVHSLDLTGARRARRPRTLVRSARSGGVTVLLSPDGLSDAWPLSVPSSDAALSDAALSDAALSDAWPLLDVDALQLAGAEARAAELPEAAALTPAEVVALVAAGRGPRHRRPSTRSTRPAIYLAAALVGAAGVAAVATAGGPSQTAQADEPVSVAEELGMVQAEQPVLSEDEATSRLQQLVASRAQREDAEAAAAQVQADADRIAAEAAAAAAEAARPQAVLPVQGARLSSGFGHRWGTLHAGVDFAAPLGTPEYAAMDGVVLRAGAASGFGLAVYIQHANGDVTVYGHMQEILVQEGQTVRAGDTIALLGNRGQSTGPHLHFEVHVGGMDGEKIDPLPWLRERGVAV
jgi:murein DD-endopeptidase MepM/ murein hydrolase activator NlpD